MPDRVALREKRHGIWRDITWSDYLANCELVAYALPRSGSAPPTASRSSPRTGRSGSTSTSAPTCCGPPSSASTPRTRPEIRYLLRDSGARVLVAEDQEQVDKAMEVIDEVDLEWVVYLDSRGLRTTTTSASSRSTRRSPGVPSCGRPTPTSSARVDAEKTPEDLVTLIYTSGTTGPPKGAMLSADNIAFGTDVFAEDDGMFGRNGLTHDDVLVSYLPLSTSSSAA
jgi:long-chain acyl-CoA synthetase